MESSWKERLAIFMGSCARSGMEYTRLVLSKMKPVRCFFCVLQQVQGSLEIVLNELAAAERPSTPAGTLGLAAASMTQSGAGRLSKSEGRRASA